DAVGGPLESLDLQADGKLAFSYQTRRGDRVAWASPAEPYRHTLPLPPRDSYDVEIVGDRVAYEGGQQSNAGVIALAKVGVSDLSGHTRTLGNLGEGSVFTQDFDFDGSRLAWWSYGCTTASIDVLSASGSP